MHACMYVSWRGMAFAHTLPNPSTSRVRSEFLIATLPPSLSTNGRYVLRSGFFPGRDSAPNPPSLP